MKKLSLILCSLFFISATCLAQLVPYEELEEKYLYKSMEEAMNDPANVIRLELKKEDLHQLGLDFKKFVNLQWVDLSKNEFTEFPKELTELPFLQYIDLSKNEIKDIPDGISKLEHLRYLGMSRNRLYLMSPKIGTLKKLETLDLFDNPLTVFPQELSGLESLKELDLRLVQINEKEKRRLQKLMPYADIKFSKTCDC